MRRSVLFTLALLLIFLLSGCNKSQNPALNSKADKTMQDSNTSSQQKQGNSESQTSAQTSVQKNADQKETANGTISSSVVAKSNNIVSSKEKEELLDQVDKELNDIFNSINTLDDIEDSDLDIN